MCRYYQTTRKPAIIGPVRPPHAVLIPFYWDPVGPVRLPLPIIPCANDRESRFGGFGLRSTAEALNSS